MTTDFEGEVAKLRRRLVQIDQRLDRIAAQEAQAAWAGGRGANGEFFQEKERLLTETNAIFDRIDALYGFDTRPEPE